MKLRGITDRVRRMRQEKPSLFRVVVTIFAGIVFAGILRGLNGGRTPTAAQASLKRRTNAIQYLRQRHHAALGRKGHRGTTSRQFTPAHTASALRALMSVDTAPHSAAKPFVHSIFPSRITALRPVVAFRAVPGTVPPPRDIPQVKGQVEVAVYGPGEWRPAFVGGLKTPIMLARMAGRGVFDAHIPQLAVLRGYAAPGSVGVNVASLLRLGKGAGEAIAAMHGSVLPALVLAAHKNEHRSSARTTHKKKVTISGVDRHVWDTDKRARGYAYSTVIASTSTRTGVEVRAHLEALGQAITHVAYSLDGGPWHTAIEQTSTHLWWVFNKRIYAGNRHVVSVGNGVAQFKVRVPGDGRRHTISVAFVVNSREFFASARQYHDADPSARLFSFAGLDGGTLHATPWPGEQYIRDAEDIHRAAPGAVRRVLREYAQGSITYPADPTDYSRPEQDQPSYRPLLIVRPGRFTAALYVTPESGIVEVRVGPLVESYLLPVPGLYRLPALSDPDSPTQQSLQKVRLAHPHRYAMARYTTVAIRTATDTHWHRPAAGTFVVPLAAARAAIKDERQYRMSRELSFVGVPAKAVRGKASSKGQLPAKKITAQVMLGG